jgi:hypothetical protein
MQVPPSAQDAPRFDELQPGTGTMHTPHVWEVAFPASSLPRQVACVQVPPSHGCPTSDAGHATGWQNPHGCWVTAPSSKFSLLHVDAMQTPTHCGRSVKEEPNGPQDWPNSDGGHDWAAAAGSKNAIARASAKALAVRFLVSMGRQDMMHEDGGGRRPHRDASGRQIDPTAWRRRGTMQQCARPGSPSLSSRRRLRRLPPRRASSAFA